MKPRLRTSQYSRIAEKSPYWAWIKEVYRSKIDGDWSTVEPISANPDSLNDEAGLFAQHTSDSQDLYELIIEAMDHLTSRQRRVIEVMSEVGTFKATAKKLRIKKASIQSILDGARKKVHKYIQEARSTVSVEKRAEMTENEGC